MKRDGEKCTMSTIINVGVLISISGKGNFKERKLSETKSHITYDKMINLQEDIITLNVYAPHKVSLYVRQKLIKLQGSINEYTIIVRDFKSFYQKWTDLASRTISKSIVKHESTIN